MTKYYQKEIEHLKKKVLHLTAVVEEALQVAVTAVAERDEELAQQVIDGDQRIDLMEVEIEEDCLKILALYQPVAIDLRFIVSALKINNDLERIGDLAVNIAERAFILAVSIEDDVPFDLNAMLDRVLAMVKSSADALVNMDVETANQVCCSDDFVDDMNREARQAVIDRVKQHPERANEYLALSGIARNLERIADHATNIAEDVIYMVDGEIVRHRGGA